MPGDVHHLSDEKQSAHLAALHRFTGELAGIPSARGHFGFLIAFGARGLHFPTVDSLFHCVERAIGPIAWRLLLDPAVRETRGQDLAERAACGLAIAMSSGR